MTTTTNAAAQRSGTTTELGTMPVEEYMDNGQLVIRAELPGVDPAEDIEVLIEDGFLKLRARRQESSGHSADGTYRSEFRYGTFARELRLPRGTTAEVVSASYRDGVLEVRMAAPAPRGVARRINVERD